MQKTALTIQDISCLGKCSITIALPILSACGIETSILPTAVLSTHTGGFGKPHIRDLSKDIVPILNHWKANSITFDAIYTGYLASIEQIQSMLGIFQSFPDAFHMVDPVMGDHGKLYSSFHDAFVKEMRKLCAKADIITPNLTEAAALAGKPYQEGPYTKEYIEQMAKNLGELGPRFVIISGVYFDEHKLGAILYDRDNASFYYAMQERIPTSYHGTGDVFASVFLGAVLNGYSMEEALQYAVGYTAACIKQSYEQQKEERFGVCFEASLGSLAKLHKPRKEIDE